jgi:FKBP-type peptidyl-prolyl cis-trans isomerase FklB
MFAQDGLKTTDSLKTKKQMERKKLITQREQVSYALGINIGRNFKQSFIDVDPDTLLVGLKEALVSDSCSLLSEAEFEAVLNALEKDVRAKQTMAKKVESEKNKQEGESFLANNAKQPGVITTKSGLQYKVLASGKGKTPTASSKVKVHYTGKLINGKVFDSSVERGQPAEFPVNGVIKGWTEALQLMKTGDKWMLYIPANLAYGEQGGGGVIPPGAALIFEVELLEVL